MNTKTLNGEKPVYVLLRTHTGFRTFVNLNAARATLSNYNYFCAGAAAAGLVK